MKLKNHLLHFFNLEMLLYELNFIYQQLYNIFDLINHCFFNFWRIFSIFFWFHIKLSKMRDIFYLNKLKKQKSNKFIFYFKFRIFTKICYWGLLICKVSEFILSNLLILDYFNFSRGVFDYISLNFLSSKEPSTFVLS